MGLAGPEAAGVHVARRLAIGNEKLEQALLRLRRDLPELAGCWTLGDRGAFELDARFVEVSPGDAPGPAFASEGRLWDVDHRSVSGVEIRLIGRSATQSELMLRPALPLPDFWQDRLGAYIALAHAAIDELGEELLWQASRLRSEGATA